MKDVKIKELIRKPLGLSVFQAEDNANLLKEIKQKLPEIYDKILELINGIKPGPDRSKVLNILLKLFKDNIKPISKLTQDPEKMETMKLDLEQLNKPSPKLTGQLTEIIKSFNLNSLSSNALKLLLASEIPSMVGAIDVTNITTLGELAPNGTSLCSMGYPAICNEGYLWNLTSQSVLAQFALTFVPAQFQNSGIPYIATCLTVEKFGQSMINFLANTTLGNNTFTASSGAAIGWSTQATMTNLQSSDYGAFSQQVTTMANSCNQSIFSTTGIVIGAVAGAIILLAIIMACAAAFVRTKCCTDF